MFTDSLDISLALAVGSASISVAGGQVKDLCLTLDPWGFRGEVAFWVSSETEADDLFPHVISPAPMKISLKVQAHLAPEGETAVPLRLQGMVTEKALLKELTIENFELKGTPVLYRYYRLCFSDEAAVIWAQHYPAEVLPEGTIKDLISAAACGIPLTVSLAPLATKRGMNVLPGYTPDGASFYDFVVWQAHTHNGGVFHDYEKGGYALTAEKPGGGNKPVALDRTSLERWEVHFPETPRYRERVINSYTEKAGIKVVERKHAVDGVHRDLLCRVPVTSAYEARCAREAARVRSRGTVVHLEHRQYPWFRFWPGGLAKLAETVWSDASYLAGKTLRVLSVTMTAQADETRPDAARNMDHGHYSLAMRSMAEFREDAFFDLPPYTPPRYPVHVEGKVMSGQGKQGQNTYEVVEDADTSQEYHRVALPVFKNREVWVPCAPGFAPGHFYFPPFKDQRVLVALGLHSARIESFLDYRPGGKLPKESQGNQLLLGKTEEDGTSIGHVYVDGKPQLNILRTSGKDKTSLKVHEGTIVLETREDT